MEFKIQHSPREKIVIVEGEEKRYEELSEDERRERRKQILEYLQFEDSD